MERDIAIANIAYLIATLAPALRADVTSAIEFYIAEHDWNLEPIGGERNQREAMRLLSLHDALTEALDDRQMSLLERD